MKMEADKDDDFILYYPCRQVTKEGEVASENSVMDVMNTTIKNTLLPSLVEYQYSEKKRICQEVFQVLQKYPELHPCEEPFVTNNGMMLTLVGLKGTIPVVHKEVIYNIPLIVWLPKDYPRSSPMIYLQPTRDPPMRIRVSKYVDRNGEVHLPVKLPIRFSLATLVDFLVTIFTDNAPLYIKKRQRSPHAELVTYF